MSIKMPNTLPTSDTESGNGSNNNLYQGPVEKNVSNDNYPDGMGIARPSSLKPGMETFPGAEASEQYKLKQREIVRFNSLSPAMGMKVDITNAGIVLDSFTDTGYDQGGSKPDIQGGANK